MLESKRQNNFDAVRLFLAASVMLSHMLVILPADYGPLKIFTNHLDGSRAVECFFVISGFLIFRSYRNSRDIWQYAERRVRRIYPGLIAIILGCVLLGMVITEVPLSDYLSLQMLKYTLFSLGFMTFAHPNLPGVFTHNQLTYVNGPLWTLKIEVMFYASVPIVWALSRRLLRFEILALIIYAASIAFWTVNHHLAAGSPHAQLFQQIAHQLPGQLSFFMMGALLEYRFADFRRHALPIVAVAVLILVGYSFVDLYALYPAALAVVVIYFCLVFPVYVPAAQYGDFSYGLYIVHFPIIQTFAALSILSGAPTLRALAVVGTCFAAAALSWHVVEKRWLVTSRRRRAPAAALLAAAEDSAKPLPATTTPA